MKFILFYFCVVIVYYVECGEYPERCLDGPFHKDVPSPENKDYKACKSFTNMTCCTVELANKIHKNNAKELYKGFHWEWCGNLGASCEQFLRDEECFYQCEPQLWRFRNTNDSIHKVPICSSYCNDWFNACKDDKTCVENWLGGFNSTSSGYHCPENSKECKTFSEVYKNGEGLCNKMWGDAFVYTKDTGNCMKFHFDASKESPNKHVRPASTSSVMFSPILLITLMLLVSWLSK